MILPLLLPALAAEPAVPAVSAAPGSGVTVASGDGRFSLTLRGRVQLRELVSVPAAEAGGSAEPELQTQLSTARLWLGGHLLSEHTRWVLQLAVAQRDFRDGATSPVFDAYFDFTQNPNLMVRVGQAFVPFDRLRTIREFALQLPDRPRVISEFALDRDLGVVVGSDRLGGADSVVAYRLGVFGGSGIHQLDARPPGGLFVGRVEVRPLGPIDDDSEGDLARRTAPGLALGVAGAFNHGSARARGTTSTVYELGTTDYTHAAADAVFKWRGLAVEAEWILREASVDHIDGVDEAGVAAVEYTRSGWGVVTQASYMVAPQVEVAARYARLGAFDGTDPTLLATVAEQPNEATVGANLYLNGHKFKVQAGASTFFGDRASLDRAEWGGSLLVDATF